MNIIKKIDKYLSEFRMQHPGNAGIPTSVHIAGNEHRPWPNKDSSSEDHVWAANELKADIKRGKTKDGRKLEKDEIGNMKNSIKYHEREAKRKASLEK